MEEYRERSIASTEVDLIDRQLAADWREVAGDILVYRYGVAGEVGPARVGQGRQWRFEGSIRSKARNTTAPSTQRRICHSYDIL